MAADWKDQGVQPPISFGGTTLTEMGRKPEYIDAQPGPAGEGTPEARIVTLSRWSLSARLRHGVPMSELLPQLQTLALVEANLLSYEGSD